MLDFGHVRNITFETRRLSEREVEIEACLLDERKIRKWFRITKQCIHHMKVTVVIDPQMTIKSAKFETLHAPYVECANHMVSADKLVGISLAKGFTKKALELYGSVSGCSHILTLLTNLPAAARQGFVFTYRFPEEEKLLTDENLLPVVTKMADQITNTCQVWHSESAVQRDLKRGDVRDLPRRLYPNFWKVSKRSQKR